LPGFEIVSIFENNDPIERQTWFRAIPINELIDGMAIPALCIGTGQTVENRGPGKLEIGQTQDSFGLFAD